MEKKTITIIAVAAVAVVIILVASFIAANKGGNDPQEPSVVGEWNLVSEYSGGWLDGYPVYSENAVPSLKAKISHYEGDFYVLDIGDEKLYCSWDGNKMVTGKLHGSSSAVFIADLPDNSNFMTVSYFAKGEAFVELYKRAGYVGKFPGLSIPVDIPEAGTAIDSYKVREYTIDGPEDIGVNTMTIRSVDGMMMFFDVVGTDRYTADGIGIYMDSGMFMSVETFEEDSSYEMMQYRGQVFYSSMMIKDTDDIWVVEYGDQSSASYPDKDLYGKIYLGIEDAVIYKGGKIVEKINDNSIGLGVIMQDDGCLKILTIDSSGDEIATWTAMFYDLGSPQYYGMSVQSSIEYKGVAYHGCYYGHFDSKKCDTLHIHGALIGEDGSSIVISQEYTVDKVLT